MSIDEIISIVNSDEEIAVYYGPQRVEIQDVDREKEVATVRILMSGNVEEVKAIDLVRD
ncbi:MAG TPA: hypothetical protein DEG71_11830 [Clostridiales bacterium]|nr:hypothetical protein [Clostridiales bacterium]